MAGTHSAAIAVAAARLDRRGRHGVRRRQAPRRARSRAATPATASCPATTRSRTRSAPTSISSTPTRSPPSSPSCAGSPPLWMESLAAFRPHLTGAVWRGTATRLNSILIELFCDDSKAAEIALIDRRIDYDVSSVDGPRGRVVDVLNLHVPSPRSRRPASTSRLTVRDYDDLRGALQPRCARAQRPRRPRRAARPRGGGMSRRLVVGAAAAVAAAASAPASPGSAALAATPTTRAPAEADRPLGDSTFRRLDGAPVDGRAARPAAAAQFLGDLVRPLRRRNAAAGPLRARAAADGWQVLALAVDQPDPVRRFIAERTLTLPVALAGATAWTCRVSSATAAAGCRSPRSSIRPALRPSVAWALVERRPAGRLERARAR